MSSKKAATKSNVSASNPGPDTTPELEGLRQEVTMERQKRNYFQLERDKLQADWNTAQQQIADLTSRLILKDQVIAEAEQKHASEIKVYKQKSKHLVYEYQNNLTHVQSSAESRVDAAQKDHASREIELDRQNRTLKVELKETELAHQELVKSHQQQHEGELLALRTDFDQRCKDLFAKYSAKLKQFEEDRDLEHRNELHQLEERKNHQIHVLLHSHEKSFADIKTYYNDITVNNLALINSLKEQLDELRKKDERMERQIAEISAENKRLRDPLDQATNRCEHLSRQLQNYEKDKAALKSCKSRLKVTEDTLQKREWENEVLRQRFQKLEHERDELYQEFIDRCNQIHQKAETKNTLLQRRVSSVQRALESRELALCYAVKEDGGPQPDSIQKITERADRVLNERLSESERLKLELMRMTRLYQDLKWNLENQHVKSISKPQQEWTLPVIQTKE